MKIPATIVSLALLCTNLWPADEPASGNRFMSENDVTWKTPGKDENDSMPVGNGDLAANVWTEQNGDLVLLVSKADAWTELGKLVKLGRIRVKLAPNPFAGASDFTQTLKLGTGAIEIESGANRIQVWVDANHPVIHVEIHSGQPASLQAGVELWRTKVHPYDQPSPDRGGVRELSGPGIPDFQPDTVLPAQAGRITWCHFNPTSVYPVVLKAEHLDSLLDKYPDPYLHTCFGATLAGPGLSSSDDHTLKSTAPGRDFRLDLVALTEPKAGSPQSWETQLDTLAAGLGRLDLEQARQAHQKWWRDFWNRSWIHVAGDANAAKVTQGYAMQRWMLACSSRGAQPAKFNGGLFTVGHDMPENAPSTVKNHDPDFRKWGNCYWNQNNRLLYWPLLASGDTDLLKPWFDMYVNSLPMARDRTSLYYHHAGAAYVETGYFWGLPCITDFGVGNPTDEIQSRFMRYHIQGALEVVAQMLDNYDDTQDADFARSSLVPFADVIVTYYDLHWPHGADGKITMSPVQSLETYQLDAVNPTPDIAGLDNVLPRLLALPADFTTPAQRKAWTRMLTELPAIATGKTAHGKLPPLGVGDADGAATILPAEKYDKPRNVENPELYVAFPYRLYGVGKPNLALARATYAARLFSQEVCWGQDGTEAAVLGLTAEAQQAATSEFTGYGDQRFPWFWAAHHDWIPDLDNGGSGMITLQLMLMQCDGKRIQLLPAWPSNWTADFKLHAPYRTTVEGHVEAGKLSNLKVTPESRAADVVVVPVK